MKVYALKVSEILKFMTNEQRQDALSLLCVSRQEKIARFKNEALKDKSMLTGLLIGYGVCEWINEKDKKEIESVEVIDGTERVEVINGLENAEVINGIIKINRIENIERLLQKNQVYQSQYGTLEFAYGEAEKPYIPKHLDIHFNISHAGDYILLAVNSEEIGIDIEEIKKSHMEVAARCYHTKEYEALQALEENSALQKDLFYIYWTAKESYIKCTGRGLSKSFASFWIDLDGWIVWDEEEAEQKTKFSIVMLEIDDGYKAAVCI